MQMLIFEDDRVEAAYRRHFQAAQLSLDVAFNLLSFSISLGSTIKFWRFCTPLEKVLMPGKMLVSWTVPLSIWLQREAFLRRREPLLAFKHLVEAVLIAHLLTRKVGASPLVSPPKFINFLKSWFFLVPELVWPILGVGFRFLLPGFLLLQTIYTILIVSCNSYFYAALQAAYPQYMGHFLGWPGVKAALGLGSFSDRAATLAVWTTLQFELGFVLPLCLVYRSELRDRQNFAKLRTARLPRDQTHIRFELAPMAPIWRHLLVAASAAAPLAAAAWAAREDHR